MVVWRYPFPFFPMLFQISDSTPGQSQGLKLTCHAGEEGPPQNIIDSLDILNCDRIDHGIRIMDDAALVTRLVTRRLRPLGST